MARTVLIVDDHPLRSGGPGLTAPGGLRSPGRGGRRAVGPGRGWAARSNAGCRRPGPWVHPTGATYWRRGAPRWSAKRCACSAWRRPAWRWRSRQSRSLTCPRVPDSRPPTRPPTCRGRSTGLSVRLGDDGPRVRAIPAAPAPAPRHRAACQLLDWPTCRSRISRSHAPNPARWSGSMRPAAATRRSTRWVRTSPCRRGELRGHFPRRARRVDRHLRADHGPHRRAGRGSRRRRLRRPAGPERRVRAAA